MAEFRTVDQECADLVELKDIATTKLLKAVLAELDAYRDAMEREPGAYTLWSQQVFGKGGVNNALDRHNDQRRAQGLPIIGLSALRHRGTPIKVVRN